MRSARADAWLTVEGWPAGFKPAPTGLTTPDASDYTTATTNRDDSTRGRPDSNRRPLA